MALLLCALPLVPCLSSAEHPPSPPTHTRDPVDRCATRLKEYVRLGSIAIFHLQAPTFSDVSGCHVDFWGQPPVTGVTDRIPPMTLTFDPTLQESQRFQHLTRHLPFRNPFNTSDGSSTIAKERHVCPNRTSPPSPAFTVPQTSTIITSIPSLWSSPTERFPVSCDHFGCSCSESIVVDRCHEYSSGIFSREYLPSCLAFRLMCSISSRDWLTLLANCCSKTTRL